MHDFLIKISKIREKWFLSKYFENTERELQICQKIVEKLIKFDIVRIKEVFMFY